MIAKTSIYRCTVCGHCCYQHDMLSDFREDATDFGCPGCAAWRAGLQPGQGWIALPPEAFAGARRIPNRCQAQDSFWATAYAITAPDPPPFLTAISGPPATDACGHPRVDSTHRKLQY